MQDPNFSANPTNPTEPADATSDKEHAIERIRTSNTHYERLGIEQNATQEAIRAAYKRTAIFTHPDKNPVNMKVEMNALFKEVQNSYETLKDPDKRKEYDLQLKQAQQFTSQTKPTTPSKQTSSTQGEGPSSQASAVPTQKTDPVRFKKQTSNLSPLPDTKDVDSQYDTNKNKHQQETYEQGYSPKKIFENGNWFYTQAPPMLVSEGINIPFDSHENFVALLEQQTLLGDKFEIRDPKTKQILVYSKGDGQLYNGDGSPYSKDQTTFIPEKMGKSVDTRNEDNSGETSGRMNRM